MSAITVLRMIGYGHCWAYVSKSTVAVCVGEIATW